MANAVWLITLKRINKAPDHTFGLVYSEELPPFYSLEPPWKDNIHNESCIPESDYTLQPRTSPKFGEVISVTFVTGRDGILFHPLNYVFETKGCIGLGLWYDIDRDNPPLTLHESRKAIEQFYNFVIQKIRVGYAVKVKVTA